MFGEDDMPCPCECGEWFDLNNGNPCHQCNKVFCTDCADCHEDHGWICESCKENIEAE